MTLDGVLVVPLTVPCSVQEDCNDRRVITLGNWLSAISRAHGRQVATDVEETQACWIIGQFPVAKPYNAASDSLSPIEPMIKGHRRPARSTTNNPKIKVPTNLTVP
jgi:hypothetical protein